MNKFIILILLIFIHGCTSDASSITKNQSNLETIKFDVVEKKIFFEGETPVYVKVFTQQWYDNKVKIDGFDGKLIFTLYDYSEKISNTANGKRFEATVKFKALIQKKSLTKVKKIEGEVNTFGVISGTFSLKDFDIIIENAQSDLIIRLSKDLKSKI